MTNQKKTPSTQDIIEEDYFIINSDDCSHSKDSDTVVKSSTNRSRSISKEHIKKLLQALDTAGVLDKIKHNDFTLFEASGSSGTAIPRKDLTPVSEFIRTIEQAVAPDSTQELTTDYLVQGIVKVKKALIDQTMEHLKVVNKLPERSETK